KVRMEMRRFRKPTTVIEGLKMNEKDLQELGTKMKKMLATGVTVKDGIVLLQGDHRDRVVEILVKRGFSESSIEVI
ncbi:MAG: stress response translation initiation inhibitor YciH, partial [Nitrososphaerales archaeon]